MGLIDTTRRMISTYEESEVWKRDHAQAMLCFDLEQVMALGLYLFRGLLDYEAGLQAAAWRGDLSADDPVWGEFEPLYERWAAASERLLARADELAGAGFALKDIEAFRGAIEEARCMIENAALDPFALPIEEMIKRLQPENPRPDRYPD